MPAIDLDIHNGADWQAAMQGNTEFALKLYGQLKATEGNLFFSPYSLSTALAMTYAGARGGTEAQMAGALCFSLGQDRLHPAFADLGTRLAAIGEEGQVELKIANALWPRVGYPFLAEYLALIEQHCAALIRAVDYGDPEAARHIINAWVEGKTQGKIQNLIPPHLLQERTAMVLTNAIYFQGAWARLFDPLQTAAAPFRAAPDRPVQVPMMNQTGIFRYWHDREMQILELPYAGNKVSMTVLLPRRLDGLAALEETLTVETLNRWTEELFKIKVRVSLPRFTIECPFRLDEVLQALGMVDAFVPEEANFSGMDGTTLLYVSAVLHQAFVRVDEAGTEASAATAVIINTLGMPPAFCADHPFLFLIRDNGTGAILFLGRVVDPGTGG